jgi:hypothetical protein
VGERKECSDYSSWFFTVGSSLGPVVKIIFAAGLEQELANENDFHQ